MFKDIKQELNILKIDKKSLRNFSLLFFVVLNIAALIFYFKQKEYWLLLALIGILFLFFGLLSPNLLKHFYRIWMALAFTLGWIITRIILIFTFYLIFAPLGLVLRIFGKDLLEQKIDKNAQSYWRNFERISDKSRYKKQF